MLTKLLDLDVEAEVTDETTAVLSTSQKGSKPTKLTILHRVGSNSVCAVGSTGPGFGGTFLVKKHTRLITTYCVHIKTCVETREHQIGVVLEGDDRIAYT